MDTTESVLRSNNLCSSIVQLHEEDDALNMWMYDAVENNGKFSRWEALGQLATMFAILGGIFYLSVLYDAPSRNPAVSLGDLSLG